MQNLSEPAVLNLPSFVMPNPFEPATSDFPESAMTFRQSFMQNRSETVAPNRPEVSASDLVPVFSHFPHIRLFSFLFRCQLPFSPYSCFRCSPLCPHSLLFPIFPQSRPAFSGFTPASVLYPYTAFALISDFPPILSRFLPALLLFSSFTLIPAFALISDFPPIPPRFFRLYSCFRPLPLYRIRSYFRFSPNPAPLFPVLLLFSSFTLIPTFVLIDIFITYSFFHARFRSHISALSRFHAFSLTTAYALGFLALLPFPYPCFYFFRICISLFDSTPLSTSAFSSSSSSSSSLARLFPFSLPQKKPD